MLFTRLKLTFRAQGCDAREIHPHKPTMDARLQAPALHSGPTAGQLPPAWWWKKKIINFDWAVWRTFPSSTTNQLQVCDFQLSRRKLRSKNPVSFLTSHLQIYYDKKPNLYDIEILLSFPNPARDIFDIDPSSSPHIPFGVGTFEASSVLFSMAARSQKGAYSEPKLLCQESSHVVLQVSSSGYEESLRQIVRDIPFILNKNFFDVACYAIIHYVLCSKKKFILES